MNTVVSLPITDAIPTIAPLMLPDKHPDTDLIAVVDQFVAADKKYRELCSAVEQIEIEIYPDRGLLPMPDALRWRRSDGKLGLPTPYTCPAFPEPCWDRELQVSKLRPKRWIVGHTTVEIFGKKTKFIKHWTIPSKAARSRADEIIAAFDAWAPPAKSPPRGFVKLVNEQNKADRLARRLEDKIYKTRATTIEGMIAKVRAGLAYPFCDPNEIDDTPLDQISACADRMADSIFRDMLRFRVGI